MGSAGPSGRDGGGLGADLARRRWRPAAHPEGHRRGARPLVEHGAAAPAGGRRQLPPADPRPAARTLHPAFPGGVRRDRDRRGWRGGVAARPAGARQGHDELPRALPGRLPDRRRAADRPAHRPVDLPAPRQRSRGAAADRAGRAHAELDHPRLDPQPASAERAAAAGLLRRRRLPVPAQRPRVAVPRAGLCAAGADDRRVQPRQPDHGRAAAAQLPADAGAAVHHRRRRRGSGPGLHPRLVPEGEHGPALLADHRAARPVRGGLRRPCADGRHLRHVACVGDGAVGAHRQLPLHDRRRRVCRGPPPGRRAGFPAGRPRRCHHGHLLRSGDQRRDRRRAQRAGPAASGHPGDGCSPTSWCWPSGGRSRWAWPSSAPRTWRSCWT